MPEELHCTCLQRSDGIGHMHGYHDELCAMRCPSTFYISERYGPFGMFKRRKQIRCELEIGHDVMQYPIGPCKHRAHANGRWDSSVEW